jgi:hypothetical protein
MGQPQRATPPRVLRDSLAKEPGVGELSSVASAWFQKEKEKQRFYLLPGMGGKAYRRKQNFILKVSICVGLIISLTFALALYFMNR